MPAPTIAIVGGGLSGLACAVHLRRSGARPLLFEAGDGLGGRVRTDVVDGFRIDRGFQVYLDAYPEAGRLLDLPALDLRAFDPGALVFNGRRLCRVVDPLRQPAHALESALQPVGSLADKLRVAWLKAQASGWTLEEIARHPEKSTVDWLRDFGFSPAMVDTFFRPFYGGIFLERELRTTSRMFEFTFRMFSEGLATLPALGMEEIPRQLASRLDAESIFLGARVVAVQPNAVTLQGDVPRPVDGVVLAADATAAAALLPALEPPAAVWRSVMSLAYAAPSPPFPDRLIALNGTPSGLVNNVSVLSSIVPDYAPPGQALLSVSVLGLPEVPDIENAVTAELAEWFGPQVHSWRHLRTDRIVRALPEQPPGAGSFAEPGFKELDGIFVCGDHLAHPSIEGAITSGLRAAEAILAKQSLENS